jgi:hypothetical protein
MVQEGLDVDVEWVRGHAGFMWNEVADRLASRAAQEEVIDLDMMQDQDLKRRIIKEAKAQSNAPRPVDISAWKNRRKLSKAEKSVRRRFKRNRGFQRKNAARSEDNAEFSITPEWR